METVALHNFATMTGRQLKRLWAYEGQPGSLRVYARAKGAADWLSRKRHDDEKGARWVREKHKGARIAAEKAATKAARRKRAESKRNKGVNKQVDELLSGVRRGKKRK